MSFLRCWCDKTPTIPLSISEIKTKAKEDAKKKLRFLKQIQIYGVLTAQVLASAILLAVTLWLFIRFPEPQVRITGFEVAGLHDVNITGLAQNTAIDYTPLNRSTLLSYNFTLHNPDLYKSIKYNVLFLRIAYSPYDSFNGATVDFNPDGKGIYQRPGATTPLKSNHTVNYTDSVSVYWDPEYIIYLKSPANRTYMYLRFVMDVDFISFGRTMGKRQIMRTTSIYFDDAGDAFIDGHGGTTLK